MTALGLTYALAALAAVLLLILLAGRLARMTSLVKRVAGNRLSVVESLAVDTKRRLLLIRCDGREVLLLTGAQDMVLGWLPEPVADNAGSLQ